MVELIDRATLLSIVRAMPNRPPRVHAMRRADLEQIFITDWSGDLLTLLHELYVGTLKDVYEALGIPRPRLRVDMERDLVRRFG